MQLDEDVIAARRESTKTILRVPWTTEQPASKEAGSVSEAASVAPATPVAAVDPSADELKELDATVKTSQASSATQAKERLLSERRKSPSPAQSKPKALPQNEFVTMALKAGALKQSREGEASREVAWMGWGRSQRNQPPRARPVSTRCAGLEHPFQWSRRE